MIHDYFRNVQNTELYKSQKTHVQSHHLEAMAVSHVVGFLLALTFSLSVDMSSFSEYIYSVQSWDCTLFWPDSTT